MPYIKQEERYGGKWTAGSLHYHIAQLIDTYVYECGYNYQTWNDVMGVLACAQQEVYRRFVAPYENTKLSTNGDAYNKIGTWGEAYGIKEDRGNNRSY